MIQIEVYLNNYKIKLDVEKDFAINVDNLEAELCSVTRTLVFYADLSAELRAQAANLKDKRDNVYSCKAQEIRMGGQKVTEGSIEEKVLLDPEYCKTQTDFNTAEMFAQKVDGFFKAAQKKVDVLLALTYKQKAEIQRG